MTNGASLPDGTKIGPDYVRNIAEQEMARMREEFGEEIFDEGKFVEAGQLFEEVALSPDFPEFLTLPAYQLLD